MNIKLLRLTTLFYLLLPNLLFYLFWTNTWISSAAAVFLARILYAEIRDARFSGRGSLTRKDLIKIILSASVLCALSGVSGFAYQTNDYWAHNTKFFELFEHNWPIRIPSDGPAVGYYYGYYVVPALFSKLVGHLCEAAIFVWTVLGISLGLGWLYVALKGKLRYALLVLTFGDLAHVCVSLLTKIAGVPYAFGDFGIEVWSNFENLFWVPNQLIASLIMGGMLVYCLAERIDIETMVLPIVLSYWWAIFPAFTSSILVGIILFSKWARYGLPTRGLIHTILLPGLLTIPVLLLFISHQKPAVTGFIWNFPGEIKTRIIEYSLNIGVTAAFSILIFGFLSQKIKTRTPTFPFYAVIGLIVILPLFRIGKVNDFLFRGLMPLLIVAGFYLYQFGPGLRAGSNPPRIKRQARIALFCMLILSTSLAATRVIRALRYNRVSARFFPNQVHFRPVPYDTYSNVYEALRARWSQAEADQYLGKSGSFYETFIAPRQ